jgi:hypothetical protein
LRSVRPAHFDAAAAVHSPAPRPGVAVRRLGALFAALQAVACVAAVPLSAAPAAPLWDDPDRQLFAGPPEKYRSGKYTDIVDQLALRPLGAALAFEPGGEALNLNTLDEVPDSSWFTNRIGRYPTTPEQLAIGPCSTPPLDPAQAWTVIGSKSDGVSPGFVIRAPDQQRYLIKFDAGIQGPRSTAADAIAARLYYAAGYGAPCNRVVFFERSTLEVEAGAQDADWLGQTRPYDAAALDAALAPLPRTSDGKYRALASLWLAGKSLGPWRFEGRRSDDPNDIIDHEHRRELRGMRLLAAWTGHADQREQNTLASWIDAGNGLGWIRHSLLDFGDCFGNLASPPLLARRLAGHAYGVDFGQIAGDFFTFGVPTRPFEAERFGRSGAVFGYFNAERFDPEAWRPSYPNPAFERMTDRDAAWMARILARFEAPHIERAIRAGRLGSPALSEELLRVLLGRRERILRSYLGRASSLSEPAIESSAAARAVCADDLGVLAGIASAAETRYAATARCAGCTDLPLEVRLRGARACLDLPRSSASRPERAELVLEWRALRAAAQREGRLRIHVARGSGRDAISGVERLP